MRSGTVAVVITFTLLSPSASATDQCGIEQVFEVDHNVPSIHILTAEGEMVELVDVAKAVLIPTRLKRGEYDVEVSRLSRDIYQVRGRDLMIKTRYCHRHARGAEAILKYESSHSWTKGELIFE